MAAPEIFIRGAGAIGGLGDGSPRVEFRSEAPVRGLRSQSSLQTLLTDFDC